MVIKTLLSKPELNIIAWVESETSVILFVSMFNKYNMALNNTIIDGKYIHVTVSI